MQSKNKPKMTANEKLYVSQIAAQPCVICEAPGPSEVHEFDQGLWFASVPCCPECHRGSKGWHGTRERWTLRKMDMLKAINKAMQRVWESNELGKSPTK